MNNKIRWGVISTAKIGEERVIPAIQASNNGVVAAVASRNLESAQAFAKRCKIPKAYGSYEELIADPEIDAIYNPLPNGLHGVWSIKCAEGGKPVLCEKPLSNDAAEAQQMADAFKQRGLLFGEAFMYRYHPQTQKVKEMVASGAVGKVTIVNASFSFPIANEDDVRLNKELFGGALMDVGCYCLNVTRHMLGEEPVEIKALANFGERSGVDETLVGVMRFPSGALTHFDCSFRAHFVQTYEIRGSNGRIRMDQGYIPAATAETTIQYWSNDNYQEIKIPPQNQYTVMAEDFADALLNNRPIKFPIEDAIAQMRAIDMLYQSAGR